MTEPRAEQPQVTATVSPAAPRSRWGAIPHHLGRARTSTVVLSLLFLAIGALWINIRPEPDPVPAGTGSVVEQPVVPVVPVPTTEAPTSEPAPTTAPELTPTSEAPTPSSDVPTPTETGTRFPTTTSEPPEPPAPPPPDATTTPAG